MMICPFSGALYNALERIIFKREGWGKPPQGQGHPIRLDFDRQQAVSNALRRYGPMLADALWNLIGKQIESEQEQSQ